MTQKLWEMEKIERELAIKDSYGGTDLLSREKRRLAEIGLIHLENKSKQINPVSKRRVTEFVVWKPRIVADEEGTYVLDEYLGSQYEARGSMKRRTTTCYGAATFYRLKNAQTALAWKEEDGWQVIPRSEMRRPKLSEPMPWTKLHSSDVGIGRSL